jgi:hypothetical protein
VVYFFALSTKKNFKRTIIFATFIKSTNQIEMEEKMKKTDSMLSLLDLEVNVNIDLTANVKIGKRGGGGATIKKRKRDFLVRFYEVL